MFIGMRQKKPKAKKYGIKQYLHTIIVQIKKFDRWSELSIYCLLIRIESLHSIFKLGSKTKNIYFQVTVTPRPVPHGRLLVSQWDFPHTGPLVYC